jgi:geranylgeranyl pyrophosphate synthase
MRYSLFNGGKRLRPLFTLHVVDALSPDRLEKGILAALAIECIHTYSLIHDDLPCMDNDDMRRGKPSLHKVFGENIALLAGDALLTLGFELLGSIEEPFLVERFAKLIGEQGMVGGQMMDISLDTEEFSKEKIFQLYELKTAYLFIAAVEMGAMVASDDLSLRHLLISYGKWFGIAFQIADDIEDHLAGKEEKIVTHFGLDQLLSWYEEAKRKALELPIPIPFLEQVFDLLDKKVCIA